MHVSFNFRLFQVHKNKKRCLNFKAAANAQYLDKIKVCLLLYIQKFSQIVVLIDGVLLLYYELTLFMYHDHNA